MRRWTAVGVVLVLLVAVATGCGSNDNKSAGGSSSSSSSKAGPGKKVAYISPVAAQISQQELYNGFASAAKELGWTSTVLDANLSPDKQVAHIDTAITQKNAGIGSWTLDPGAAAGAYKRAVDAGLPVIGMSSEGPGVTATVWLEFVTCKPGGPSERSAKFIADRIPGAKLIIMGGPPAPSIVATVKCFTAAAKAAGLNVIAKADNTSDTSQGGQRLFEDLLTKHPDVQAVWSYNDATALGASAAIIAGGKKVRSASGKDGIVIISHNADQEALDAIRQNRLTGTWDPETFAMGVAGIKLIKEALEGGVNKTYPALTVKSTFFTSENIGSYKKPADRGYTLENIPLVGS